MAAFNNKEAFSSFSNIHSSRYDVFLSFSGCDTRNKFTSHLLAALERNGFYTFRDDTKLRRGETIGSELLSAIEGSKVSVIIFSESYAASRWCLDELLKIMECKSTMQQTVLPVFYGVDPSDVRSQKGCYAQAFAKHEEHFRGALNHNKVAAWKDAMAKAANVAGYILHNVEDGDEAKVINKIVQDIAFKLNPTWMEVAEFPVGIDSRVQHLVELLNLDSTDVQFLAIWGIGGIGKTTLAKAIYNGVHSKFESSSFLANVSATSKQINGQVLLQDKLISSILMNDAHRIKNEHHGIKLIEQRLWCRTVLLVLDDVDDVKQLRSLAIHRKRFHPGSRIILTTRNMSALSSLQLNEKLEVYSLMELNEKESLQLFSWHCFNKEHPAVGFKELSEKVIAYSRGLPLVLEIMGSFLSDKGIPEWKSELEKLKRIPNHDVQGRLKISLDSLDEKQKGLFLDIACFFIDKEKDLAANILKGLEFYPESDIKVLSRRCLVKVICNRLTMHDLIRDMGREIVRQESSEAPGKRSRLWHHEDVLEALRYNTGTETFKGLNLSLPTSNDVRVDAKAFAKMTQLKLLHLDHVLIKGSYDCLSKRLVSLSWMGFPLDHISSNLCVENLVALDLSQSKLKQLWKENKILDNLKFLNLSHSYHLTRTPDFSGLLNLEELLLNNCMRLTNIHSSICCLKKILVLDLKNCKNLVKLPRSFFMLTSLQKLDISGCRKLNNFVGFKGSTPKSWYSDYLSWTLRVIKGESMCLSLASIQNFSNIRKLNMAGCNLSSIPGEIGSLVSLKYLDLSENQFSRLPSSISFLSQLEGLYLRHCPKLQTLPALPTSLQAVHVNYCTSLKSIPVESEFQDSPSITFYGCKKIVHNRFSNNFRGSIASYQGSSTSDDINIFLPGGDIPDWFLYQSTNSILFFKVPPVMGKKIQGWVLCVIFEGYKDCDSNSGSISYSVINKTKDIRIDHQPTFFDYPTDSQDNMWLNYVPNSFLGKFHLEDGDEMEFFVEINQHFFVKTFGVTLCMNEFRVCNIQKRKRVTYQIY